MNRPPYSLGILSGLLAAGCTPVPPEAAPDRTEQHEPKPATPRDTLTGVVQVVAAGTATCALNHSGAVDCWGLFTHGTFEDPLAPLFGLPAPTPVRVEGPQASRITAYPRGVGMLDTTGLVFAMGRPHPGDRERRRFEPLGGHATLRVFGAVTSASPLCWLQVNGAVECDSGRRGTVASGILLDERAPGCFAHGNALQCTHENESIVDAVDPSCTQDLQERSVFRVDLGFKPVALYEAPGRVCARSEDGILECIRRDRIPTGCGARMPGFEPPKQTHTLIRKTFNGPFDDVALGGARLDHGFGLRPDGVVVSLDDAKPVPGAEGISELTAWVGHACGLTGRGRVLCWGDNEAGQLGAGFVGAPALEEGLRARFVRSGKTARPVARGRKKRPPSVSRTIVPLSDVVTPRLCPAQNVE